ncbi:MAG: sigma-54-dependent Fis family transcriptional regulator [Opitutae bacterium]|nr:sigma-54-dependent Fis family transcriptional regulator [Opitutae bacterium]
MSRDTSSLAGREILLLEDDAVLRRRLSAHLRALGAEVTEATNLAEARRLAREIRFDYALADLHLPDGEALALLRERAFSENTGVVVMTAFGGVPEAVEAMRLGAGDYVTKPFEPEELPLAFLRCRQARITARREEHQLAARPSDGWFFGRSLAAVRAQLDTILAAERRLEHHLPPVLLEGETGTGKSALARWLHREGPRSAQPFVAVNCAALPEQLAESELFGHERGAFTDAKQARIGLLEAADGGTLFLDEIGSLSPATQAKVLTAIEEGRIRRLGGTKELEIDACIIAANNRPLRALAETGAFREDLFHRLHLLHVTLPPLRERGEDIVELARHLLAGIAARHRLRHVSISPEGARRLQAQRWPGNVRELAHELERAVIFGGEGELDFAHLEAGPGAPAADWRNPAWRLPESGFNLDHVTTAFIEEALRETGGNVSAAARRLGVTREFLRYRLQPAERTE